MDTGESAGRYDNQVTVETFKPEEVKAVEAEPKQVVEPQANAEGDVSQETDESKQSKKRNGYKEKLERTKAELAEARAQLEAAKPKAEPTGEKAPKVDDFETYEAFYAAQAKHEARSEFARLKAEDEKKSKESDLRKQAEAQRDAFKAKADEFMKGNPDFEEVIKEAGLAEVPQLGMVLMESDMGPELAYHLAKNPEDLEQLKGMTYTQKARFIGRLEARLEKDTPEPKPTKEVKVSKAPAPIVPVGKSATTASYSPYEAKGKDDHDEYMKWRASQKR